VLHNIAKLPQDQIHSHIEPDFRVEKYAIRLVFKELITNLVKMAFQRLTTEYVSRIVTRCKVFIHQPLASCACVNALLCFNTHKALSA
jgi:fibronectin type 3 domain-containing protein